MAIKVYRTTDKIKVKIGETVFHLSPFSQEQKLELMQNFSNNGGEKVENLAKFTFMACKFAIKAIEGMTYEDDTPYVLEFDEKGVSDKCLGELMNTEISMPLITACQSFLRGVPKEILDPATGEKLKDVEILSSGVSKKST